MGSSIPRNWRCAFRKLWESVRVFGAAWCLSRRDRGMCESPCMETSHISPTTGESHHLHPVQCSFRICVGGSHRARCSISRAMGPQRVQCEWPRRCDDSRVKGGFLGQLLAATAILLSMRSRCLPGGKCWTRRAPVPCKILSLALLPIMDSSKIMSF